MECLWHPSLAVASFRAKHSLGPLLCTLLSHFELADGSPPTFYFPGRPCGSLRQPIQPSCQTTPQQHLPYTAAASCSSCLPAAALPRLWRWLGRISPLWLSGSRSCSRS